MKCKRCRQAKSEDEFSRDSTRKTGRFPWCKSCQVEYARESKWQRDDAVKNGHVCPLCDTEIRGHPNRRFCSQTCKDRARSLKARFGLTVEQFRLLIEEANGVCPICLESTQNWHVDHNHSTGEVTGVVCNSCNIGALSRTYHNPRYIRRLLDYVENPPAPALGVLATAPAARSANLHTMWNHSRAAGIVPPARSAV